MFPMLTTRNSICIFFTMKNWASWTTFFLCADTCQLTARNSVSIVFPMKNGSSWPSFTCQLTACLTVSTVLSVENRSDMVFGMYTCLRVCITLYMHTYIHTLIHTYMRTCNIQDTRQHSQQCIHCRFIVKCSSCDARNISTVHYAAGYI